MITPEESKIPNLLQKSGFVEEGDCLRILPAIQPYHFNMLKDLLNAKKSFLCEFPDKNDRIKEIDSIYQKISVESLQSYSENIKENKTLNIVKMKSHIQTIAWFIKSQLIQWIIVVGIFMILLLLLKPNIDSFLESNRHKKHDISLPSLNVKQLFFQNIDTSFIQKEIDGADIVIKFRNGLFPKGRAELQKEALNSLNTLCFALQQDSLIVKRIAVTGHADDLSLQANSIYQDNDELALARAYCVIAFIRTHSRIAGYILTSDFGRLNNTPFPNNSELNRQKNRTVVLRITIKA
jgi:flagellar motor protein MotB